MLMLRHEDPYHDIIAVLATFMRTFGKINLVEILILLILCGCPPRRKHILNHCDLVHPHPRVLILVGTATLIIQLFAVVHIFQDVMR